MQINLQNWNPILVYGLNPSLFALFLEYSKWAIALFLAAIENGEENTMCSILGYCNSGFPNLMNY
jgi:hypothetical protein